MIVYCDTSFLVSFLYEGDANYKAARELAGRFDGEDFVLCQTHQLELPASVRAATHRAESPIPIHVARTLINRFDRAWNGRAFVQRNLHWMNRWRWPALWGRLMGGAHATRRSICGMWRQRGHFRPGLFSPLTSGRRKSAPAYPFGPRRASGCGQFWRPGKPEGSLMEPSSGAAFLAPGAGLTATWPQSQAS